MHTATIIASSLFALANSAAADEAIFANLISKYETNCALEADIQIADGGAYTVHFGANNTITAYVVTPQTLTCDNQNVGLCGTRGCELKVYVDGQTYNMVGWEVSALQVEQQSLLLVHQNGRACNFDFPNSTQCYALWEWDEERSELKFLR